MDYLLLFAYGAIFLALVAYVVHLRSRLTEIEKRLADLSVERDLEGDD
ncbi:CcmD family protein [Natrarchaeobaculum aegyptiacum]|uniref:CcmD family protein n=1 Tax=Natrarchaeobaculum aegyptiacum TaxID=745377 RepID=A0A2Z2I2D5_9EURY|nr:CcmD family protein [Natrarchaeobaculum aegyptiacum]ARS90948.1 CcmD family protein [Natrarchaeobaculum aegyptiacum]